MCEASPNQSNISTMLPQSSFEHSLIISIESTTLNTAPNRTFAVLQPMVTTLPARLNFI